MTRMKSEFWNFFYSKGLGSQKAEEARWLVDVDVTLELSRSINWGEGEIVVPSRLVAEAERDTEIEDVPFVPQDVYVLSDRTRAVFEEHSPGDCQFFPIDIRFQGKSLGLKYWVMHCLHTIDCVDPARSYRPSPNREPPYYVKAAVNPDKVPSHINTFRIRYSSRRPVVRDFLRKIIVKAKITGCDFYPPD